MSVIAIADPFAASHEDLAEQLEPFCDGDLTRFSDHELLHAYDLATAWAHDLITADTAVMAIAAEWQTRYRRAVPRGDAGLTADQYADFTAQFDSAFARWDIAA